MFYYKLDKYMILLLDIIFEKSLKTISYLNENLNYADEFLAQHIHFPQ